MLLSGKSSHFVLFIVCVINICMQNIHAGIYPLTLEQKNSLLTSLEKFGYIEYRPNGTLILRSTMENGTNAQNLLLFRTILNAVRVAPLPPGSALAISIDGIKMYGDGVEHKFPPFLERILQRIQTFFSVYKYTDTSRPQVPTALVNAPLMSSTISTTSTTSKITTTTNGIDNKLETTTFEDAERVGDVADDYTEFISIGENDGYITVGQD